MATSPLDDLIIRLGPEIEDPEEETFLLYSQPSASHNLGFVDSKARCVDVAIHARDYTIHQSPGILSSSRPGGTTGAVLWKINPLFAQWLSSPSNPLFASRALSRSSSLIELGCGISPLNALALRSLVARYVLTDQPYVLKLLQQNLDANPPAKPSKTPSAKSSAKSSSARATSRTSSSSSSPAKSSPSNASSAAILLRPLDWETDHVSPALTGCPETASFDAVISCDCIYNEALVQPLVNTCADICRLRLRDPFLNQNHDQHNPHHDQHPNPNHNQTTNTTYNISRTEPSSHLDRPSIAIIAQQLRDDSVFSSWLAHFSRLFRVWRVPDELLPEELRPAAGFVIHIGVLKAQEGQ